MRFISTGRTLALLLEGLSVITLLFTAPTLLAQPMVSHLIPGDYIVVLKKGQSPAKVAKSHGLEQRHTYAHALNGFAASIPAARLAALKKDRRVALIEPDQIMSITAQTIPAGIARIRATRSTIAKIDGLDERVDVDIAILDTGIDLSHPDLNVVNHISFVTKDNGSKGNDVHGHGTHVAGIAAALDNDFGVVGVAPGARLWAVKVMDDTGNGPYSTVIKGIDYVTQNAATISVANLSLGWVGTSDALRLAIQNSVAKGIVYTAAAGNNYEDVYGADGVFNTPDDFIPAAYPEVITVSAICDYDGVSGGVGGFNALNGWDDAFAAYSNFGRKVDFAAPGASVWSTVPGGYGYKFGTSMAAPHVAGAVALYIAEHGRANGAAGVAEIRQALLAASEPQSAWGPTDTEDRDGTPEPLVSLSDFLPDPPPQVTITAPATDATWSGTVTVSVSATGSLAVIRVEWYLNGILMGSSNAMSASFLWDTTGSTNGAYILQARAYDAGNNAGTSILTVAVQNPVADNTPPVTQITSPGSGSTLAGIVQVVVSAIDDVGITEISWSLNGTLMATSASVPASYNWDTTACPDGAWTLQTVARDAAGNLGTATTTVTVQNGVPDENAPTVELTSPVSGVNLADATKVYVSASDNVAVTRVVLLVDGKLFAASTQSAPVFDWNTSKLAPGAHTLQATAVDAAGNLTRSTVLTVYK